MQCKICKSRNTKLYKIVNTVPIFQCQECKLAFVDPSVSRKKTEHIYSFVEYKKREAQFVNRYQKTLQLVKRFSRGSNVLEIGAGFGLLSSILSKNGYQVDVLEPDVTPYYLQGLPVKIYTQYFEEFVKKRVKKYDVIILYDILEHVSNPIVSIRNLLKLLNTNGIVIIQTPNYQSIMARLVHNWAWWMVEDHRYFFSKQSFSFLFNKKNWKQLLFSTYEEWPDFKKNLDGNFVNKMSKALYFAWFIPFYFLLRNCMWRFGYGGLYLAIWRYNKQ